MIWKVKVQLQCRVLQSTVHGAIVTKQSIIFRLGLCEVDDVNWDLIVSKKWIENGC